MGDSLRLVDLPGYAYARASRERVRGWTLLVRDYLAGRAPLRRALLLMDARRGPGRSDGEVMDLLDSAAVAFRMVLTKADKVPETELEERARETEGVIAGRPAAMLVTSAAKGTGVEGLRDGLAGIAVVR